MDQDLFDPQKVNERIAQQIGQLVISNVQTNVQLENSIAKTAKLEAQIMMLQATTDSHTDEV